MSMISDLIKRLKTAKKGCIDYHDAKTIDEAIEVIQELSEKLHTANMERSSQYYHGGWIPCSERMPEEKPSIFAKFKSTPKWNRSMWEKGSYTVIVTRKHESGERITDTARTHDGQWMCDKRTVTPYKITAWQPLPEPYKETE